MKKRFLIPLIAVAAPLPIAITIGVADVLIHQTACHFGGQASCTELDRRQAQAKLDHAAREAEEKAAASAKAIAEAKALEKEKAEAAFEKAWDEKGTEPDRLDAKVAAEKCIRKDLKDPESLKTLSTQVVAYDATEYTVLIEYTATNSFGARVRELNRCTIKR